MAMDQRAAAIRLEVNGVERQFRGPTDTPLHWVQRCTAAQRFDQGEIVATRNG